MITELELENFKQHKHLVVHFNEGMNTITGPNYAGKTTLLEAIAFAFWGPSVVPGGAACVMRKGASSVGVTVKFMLNATPYEVKRTKTTCTLSENGEALAKSASVVSTEVARLLGVSKKRFMQLKYSPQGLTQQLLTLGAPELHKVIEELAGVDIVNRVLDRCSFRTTSLKSVLETLPEFDLEEDTQQKAIAVKSLAQGEKSARAKDTELKASESQVALARQTLSEALESNKAIREAKRAFADDQAALEAAEQHLIRIHRELSELPKDFSNMLESLRSQRTQFRTEADFASTRATQLTELLKQAEDNQVRSAKLAGEIEHLAQKLTDLYVDMQQLELAAEQLDEAQKAESKARHDLNALKTLLKGAECPTCHRPFEDHDPEQLKQELATAQATSDDIAKGLKTAKEHYHGLHKQSQDFSVKEAQLQGKQEELERLKTAVVDIEDSITEIGVGKTVGDLEGERDALLKSLHKVEAEIRTHEVTETTYKVNKSALAETEARIKQLQERIAAHVVPEGEIVDEQELNDEVNSGQAALDRVRDAVNSINASIAQLKNQISTLERQLEEHAALNARRAKAEEQLQTIAQLQKYLRDNRDRFVSGVWAGLMQHASAFARAATGGGIESMSRSSDGEFSFVDTTIDYDEPMPVAASSGAQKSIMGLAVQCALSQLLPSGFDALMLDEPSRDMDPEHSMAVNTLLSNHNGQCLVVSHSELDASVASHTINL